jgi:U3 small nucleolar RNA-associated protein 20
MLPWAEYEAILRFHLGRLPRMLDYQKQLVRTVIAVLNAFHFDMSSLEKKSTETEIKIPSEVIEEEMEADDERPAENIDVAPKEEAVEDKMATGGENAADGNTAPEAEDEEDLAEILEQVEQKQKQIHKSEAAKAADTIKYVINNLEE